MGEFEPLSAEESILLNVFRQEHKDGYNLTWMPHEVAEKLQELMVREWLNSSNHKARSSLSRAKLARLRKLKVAS